MPPHVDTRNALDSEVQGSTWRLEMWHPRQGDCRGSEPAVVKYDEFEEIEHWGRGCGCSYFLHPK